MTMSEDEYENHREEYNGYCIYCKDITNYGGVEPDARKYDCEECGHPGVMGIEEALMSGLIQIGDEE
jgi:hypothetical protein